MHIVMFVANYHTLISGICLRHLNNIKENISGITVVTPDTTKTKEFYHWLGIENINFLEDQEVCDALDISKSGLDWTRKQYAIMNLDRLINDDQILNMDADVIINTPLALTQGKQRYFYLENEYYVPYFDTVRDLFGLQKKLANHESFNSDFMIFDRCFLQEMRDDSKDFRNFESWKKVVDRNTLPGAVVPATSEYETYGTWLQNKHPEVMIFVESSTFHDNMKYQRFLPSLKNLQSNPGIIPLRQTYDRELDWNQIYPDGWQQFLRL